MEKDKRKFNIIYRTTNIKNGMIYIGCHSTDNINDGYIGSGFRLRKAIEEMGEENFLREILYTFDSRSKMLEKEAEIVNEEFISRKDVYNMVVGGHGGYNKGATGLRHMYHPFYKKRCAVSPSSIEKMIEEGWVLGKEKSSTKGTIWIHKGEEKKMINPRDLDFYISNNWIKGLPKSPTHGKVWIYNQFADEFSLCNKNDLSSKLYQGWIKKKWAPSGKCSCWINNGEKNLRVKKEEVQNYTSIGWKKGMITKRWDS